MQKEIPNDSKHFHELLDIIDGLLKMCVDREAEIAELQARLECAGITDVISNQGATKDGSLPEQKANGVLIVDANVTIQRHLTILMQGAGFEVIGTASDATRAIELFRSLNPAIVTMDLELPNKEGLTTTREIKRINGKARIIMVCTELDEKVLFEALKAGASEYCPKPVNTERLLHILKKLKSA